VNDSPLLHISPRDNVCVVTRELQAGEEVTFDGRAMRLTTDLDVGHKIAVLAIRQGDKVVKYGAPIGSATQPIFPGDHVHSHNLASDYLPSAGRVEPKA